MKEGHLVYTINCGAWKKGTVIIRKSQRNIQGGEKNQWKKAGISQYCKGQLKNQPNRRMAPQKKTKGFLKNLTLAG